MAFLLARKLKMEQCYEGDTVVPVTVLEAAPAVVTDIRTKERDGYTAVQIGSGRRRHASKALIGHLRGAGPFGELREFSISDRSPMTDTQNTDGSPWTIGDRINVSIFKPGDVVSVMGISKGKGFQGVVKRHHFHGQDATHGTKDQLRMPGSISGIGRGGGGPVTKGKRMAGRMGGERVTVQGLRIIAVDPEHQRLIIRGAVPGARGALLEVRTWQGSWS